MSARFLSICESRTARSLIPAVVGFLGYGGWGYLCNMGHGWAMGLQSGLVQGSLSFTITLVFNAVMEFVYGALGNRVWSIIATLASLVLVSFTLTTLAGTPEVIATIAPGSMIGSFYIYSYIGNLAAAANRGRASSKDSGTLVAEPEVAAGGAEKKHDNSQEIDK